MTMDQALKMLDYASSMHAQYWELPALKEAAYLNPKDETGQRVPVSFDGWLKNFLTLDIKDLQISFTAMVLKGCGVNLMETSEEKELVDLISEHGEAIVKAIYRKLNSRPKTLVHGDLRLDNLFVSKNDPNEFKIIDW